MESMPQPSASKVRNARWSQPSENHIIIQRDTTYPTSAGALAVVAFSFPPHGDALDCLERLGGGGIARRNNLRRDVRVDQIHEAHTVWRELSSDISPLLVCGLCVCACGRRYKSHLRTRLFSTNPQATPATKATVAIFAQVDS